MKTYEYVCGHFKSPEQKRSKWIRGSSVEATNIRDAWKQIKATLPFGGGVWKCDIECNDRQLKSRDFFLPEDHEPTKG